MSISAITYPVIPSLYGLMQLRESFDPTPLVRSGITQVQGGSLALTGRGVVIGFLDTGIRYEEEVFRNEDGSTRILGIWDQTIPDSHPPESFTGQNTGESRSTRRFRVKTQGRSYPVRMRSVMGQRLPVWRREALCGADWDSWGQRPRQIL